MHSSVRRISLLVMLAVAAAACTTGQSDATVTTTTTTTTTIVLSVRSTAESPVTIGPDVDEGASSALVDEIGDLRTVVENLRGLGFIGPPRIAVLSDDAYAERRTEYFEAMLDGPTLAVETRFYRAMGLLAAGQDMRALLLQTQDGAVAYYDPATAELVVNGEANPLTSADRSVIVREMVRMLTDQYHSHSQRVADLAAEGSFDEALALSALATADAIYAQLRYIEQLPRDDQLDAVAEQPIGEAPGPPFLADELAFAADAVLTFVGAQLDEGGLAFLDQAYSGTATTENLLHPARFAAAEGAADLPPPVAEVQGYQLIEEGTLGELRLRGLLSAALSRGMQTQVGDGWGGDRYMLFADADDVAFVYTYRGDSVDDTLEVAQGFLDHAADVMGLAEPIAAGGGLEFVGPAAGSDSTAATEDTTSGALPGPYVFVDRSRDGLVVVISTAVDAGRSLRAQVSAP